LKKRTYNRKTETEQTRKKNKNVIALTCVRVWDVYLCCVCT
jgi:hypothetical protein